MCCNSRKLFAKEVYDLFGDNDAMDFYKVVRVVKNLKTSGLNITLEAPYRDKHQYVLGVNTTNTTDSYRQRYKNRDVYKGFHVCRNLAQAKLTQNLRGKLNHVIIKVSCNRRDLIGASEDTAVFKEAFISRYEFERACNEKTY